MNLFRESKVYSGKKQLQIILIVFFIDILIVLFCNFLNTILFDQNNIPLNNSSLFLSRYGIYWGMLIIILIGPFIEELTFRLGFSFRKTDVIISIAFLLLYVSKLLIKKNNELLFIPIVIIAILLSFLLAKFTTQRFYSNMNENRIFYIISFSLLFAIIHIFSFNKIEIQWIVFYIIALLPIFIGGILLAFLRIKIGFFIAVLYHCLHNAFFIGFIFLCK